jgi:hypothetical protein
MQEAASQQYREWIARVRQVPLRLVQLEMQASEEIRCDRFAGSKINGALWGNQPPSRPDCSGLCRVAAQDPSPHLRALARHARSFHNAPPNSAGYAPRLLCLGLDFAPLELAPAQSFLFNLLLLGPLAATWPAWVQAAERMHLEPGRLQRRSYALWVGDGPPAENPPLADASLPPTTLGDLAAAVGSPATPPANWLLRLQTPLVLERRGEKLYDLPTLEPVIVSALSALGAVAEQRPGPDNTAALRALAAEISPRHSTLARGPALYRQDKGRPGYVIQGLLGALALPALPPPLVEVLTLAQFTHIGQHAAFGLGRYVLLPQEE